MSLSYEESLLKEKFGIEAKHTMGGNTDVEFESESHGLIMLLFKENKVELYIKEDSQGYTYEGERNLIESEVENLNKLGYDF